MGKIFISFLLCDVIISLVQHLFAICSFNLEISQNHWIIRVGLIVQPWDGQWPKASELGSVFPMVLLQITPNRLRKQFKTFKEKLLFTLISNIVSRGLNYFTMNLAYFTCVRGAYEKSKFFISSIFLSVPDIEIQTKLSTWLRCCGIRMVSMV